jgi:hypothetical protein
MVRQIYLKDDSIMSVISNTHSFLEFNSGVSEALSGQRLAKVTYKTPKTGEKVYKSICVSLPFVAEVSNEQLVALQPHIFKLIEDTQDKIIREAHESGKANVHDTDISVDACVEYLNAESVSGRLTKEGVVRWADDSGLADMLRMRFAEILGVSDTPTEIEAQKVEVQVKGYVDKFAALAGAKTYYAPDVASKLLKALEIGSVGDSIANKFQMRLQDMVANPKNQADMLGL